jgi:mannose-1-phosphate guanylyltransferase / mannose-6-phosphate isomerase
MCGGAGTRVWPESRESLPKQFIPLVGARSTFQLALETVSDEHLFAPPLVITNNEYRFLVAEQIAELGLRAEIVLEPSRRDSGPAVAVAAQIAADRKPDGLVGIFAADHLIDRRDRFLDLCREAAAVAADGRIVTFGTARPRASATSGPAPASTAATSASSTRSSKSRTPTAPGATWPKAICGTPAILSFART